MTVEPKTMSKPKLVMEIAGAVGKIMLYIALVLYIHEFNQLGKQVNEVRRLVETRCK